MSHVLDPGIEDLRQAQKASSGLYNKNISKKWMQSEAKTCATGIWIIIIKY